LAIQSHVDCPKSTSEKDPDLVFGVTKMTLSNVEAPGVRGSPKLCGEEEERDGGDGESLPDTPPNEAAIVHQDSKVKNDNKTAHPFSLDIKVFVNFFLRRMMILITTMMTRLTAWQWVF